MQDKYPTAVLLLRSLEFNSLTQTSRQDVDGPWAFWFSISLLKADAVLEKKRKPLANGRGHTGHLLQASDQTALWTAGKQ